MLQRQKLIDFEKKVEQLFRKEAGLAPTEPTPWYFWACDHCNSCGLQEDHCSCVFEPHSGAETIFRDCGFARGHKRSYRRSCANSGKHPRYRREKKHLPSEARRICKAPRLDSQPTPIAPSSIPEHLALDSHSDGSGSVNDFSPQSGTTNDNSIMKVSNDTQQQNVMFADQIDPYMYAVDSEMDPTRSLQDSDDALLENFFTRPIKIAEEQWSTSETLAFDLNPWEEYFNNPRVINRLANFNLLKCNLKVKVVINGNGFQYGRALVTYLPFDVYDTLSSNAALIREDLVQASQQPRIFLDPTTSTGGEMKLPFFWHRNYFDIPTSAWSSMGTLFFRSLNTLKHANGATDVVTISVFAWAEDVSMNVLTSVDPDTISPQFTAQSGAETDEVNKAGIISGPATAIAKVAKTMSGVPTIGPFAMATDMIATTTAAVAKMFGYCRPIVTKSPEPFKPVGVSSLAVTNTGDQMQQMTVDHKQELSIDPRIAGLGSGDPMNIKEIAKRESYLTTFSWAIGSPPEQLLWNSRIDPVIWAENSELNDVSFHFPACAMAALPFKYWTGTMKFRFQVVASAFHKGRLKIVYDPNYLASNEYNTNYLNVIDIADQQDFTIEIANGQDTTLLPHHRPGLDSVTQMYGSSTFSSKEEGNGVVGVYIVNELTTPNSEVNNDIEVNVFVSMGDDFEVFVPDDHFQYFTFKPYIETPGQLTEYKPQSGAEIVSESQNTAEPSAPQQEQAMELGPTKSDNSLVNKVFTGEAIVSFRTMLKRYNLWTAIGQADNTDTLTYGRFSMFPYLRGGVDGAVGDIPGFENNYNYCNTVLLHWVTNAFQGWRGSIRYKWVPRGTLSTDHPITFYAQRAPIGETEYYFGQTNAPTYSNQTNAARSTIIEAGQTPVNNKPPTGVKGVIYQTGKINPVTEFEVPFYSPFRFSPGKTENYTGIGLWTESYDYRLISDGDSSTLWDIHVAAGEDFQTYFFTGLPRMYYEAAPFS